MKIRSAKAKGKRLEKWVLDQILKWFPSLTSDDVRITIGSETGADIKISERRRNDCPYSIECKSRETFKTLYGYYEQAAANILSNEKPVVVIKMNNKKPLALIDAEFLFEVLGEYGRR
jgi:hypothetical protein